MKKVLKELLDYIIKNKYIITLVIIVIFLYAIGFLKVLAEVAVLVILVAIAIFFGKKLQDGKFNIKDKFDSSSEFRKEGNVYYYEKKEDKESSKDK